ncbi:MAG: glycogen/starch synthase [Prevotellaceae bacterium]|jgi:glycosyltransferase involved in cell wall biosynthesis|nr:glycogen/starch synthase [Prevotellaceae bacterium]
MTRELLIPDYIFETSWEVCNKVGGIYTVLSTRANTLQAVFHDKLFFIGPDLGQQTLRSPFVEADNLCAAWKRHAAEHDGLAVRVGRWDIPGRPIVFLVDFHPFFSQKNELYTMMWNRYGVDSLHAYGDYDEASMFAYAAGRVAESFYRYNLTAADRVVYQAHEWMTAMGALYLQTAVPEIATIFTTHATSIGRSIAGNNKPLYDYLFAYNGDQMAGELNMQSKHSVEKQTAHRADCFTTVSEITNNECKELLDKPADVVLMNGFEEDLVPPQSDLVEKRTRTRAALLHLAGCLTGTRLRDEETLVVGTSGRYEFKNKGIDVFVEALGHLNRSRELKKEVLAVIAVPGWVSAPRSDLQERLQNDRNDSTPLEMPFLTHWLHNTADDLLVNRLPALGLCNAPGGRVKVLLIPCYLDGADGILNLSYYDLLAGEDLSVYPSYYEPWGYTPLESIAFGVPTITTDLAGFGRWVKGMACEGIDKGVEVLHRSDYNYGEVAEGIGETITRFAAKNRGELDEIGRQATQTAEKALWKHFIGYYYEAYDFALRRAAVRLGVAPR